MCIIKAQTKKQLKKSFSILLASILALQVLVFPISAFADNETNYAIEHDFVPNYGYQPIMPLATVIDTPVHLFDAGFAGNTSWEATPDGQMARRMSGTSGTGSNIRSWNPFLNIPGGPLDLRAYWEGHFVFELFIPHESFTDFYTGAYHWIIFDNTNNDPRWVRTRMDVHSPQSAARNAAPGTWATVTVPLNAVGFPGNDAGNTIDHFASVNGLGMYLRWDAGLTDSPVFINNPRLVLPAHAPASQVVALTFDATTGLATAEIPETGQDVEFAIGTTDSGPTAWVSGTYNDGHFTHLFDNLPTETYVVYARAVGATGIYAALYTWDGVATSVVVAIVDDQELVDNAALTWDTIRGTNTWGDQDVRRPLTLPTTIGAIGSQVYVSWASNTPGAITNTGTTNRLYDQETDKDVVLTATITRGTAQPRTVTFNLRMLAVPAATQDRLLPVAGQNLANTVAVTIDDEPARRIDITNWGNYHVMHILNAAQIGATGNPAMVDLLSYANQYFVFDMRVSDASLLSFPGDNWLVIDTTGDWNNNTRLQLPIAYLRAQQPNEWFTVAVPMTAGNATAGSFNPASMDTVRRMGFHMSFGADTTGTMYFRNVHLSATDPTDGTGPGEPEVGAYVFIDFNDDDTMLYLYTSDFTAGQPVVPIPPTTYADARAFGIGIDVGAGGDGGRPNFMQQHGGVWGMARGNFIYVHVLEPAVRYASRVELEIEYWQQSGWNHISLQYASTAGSFTGTQINRVGAGGNNSWQTARGILDNANFGNDPQPGGHNQGASFRITGPGPYDGIVIRSIRVTEILLTDQEAVNAAFNGLTWDTIRAANTLQTLVEGDLNLITIGASGTDISWASSCEDTIDPDTGEVTRQQDNTTVTLTATISRGEVSRTRTFTLVVRGAGIGTDEDAVDAMYDALTWDRIRGVNVYQNNVTTNLILPHMGLYMTDITWTSSNSEVINATTLSRFRGGRDIVSRQGVIQPSRPNAAHDVTVTATISRGTVTRTKAFNLTVPARFDWASHMRQAIAQNFDAKDHAISDFNVLGFGAMTREMATAAGITDFCNREAFQAAIDAAFHNGGGVVYAPAGIYDFHTSVTGTRTERGTTFEFQRVLSLHQSVQLRGEWDYRINDPSWQGTEGDPLGGTILAVFAGAGTDNFQTYVDSDQIESQTGQPMAANVSDRFICMEEGTGVTNLSIWYPEQDLNASTTVTVRDAHGRKTGDQEIVRGVTFPWTFVQRTGNSATIDNVTLVNAWNGFIAFPAEMHYIVNTNMTALSHGIIVHTCTDIGRIENVNINPSFWARSGLPGAPSYDEIRTFTRAYGVGFRMHRSDWEYIYGLNISGYNIGIWIGREIVGNETPNGQIYNSHVLDCVVALHIDGVNSYGFLISNSTFEGSTAAVYIDEYFRQSLQFNGVTLNGPIINNGNYQHGVISFESCTFDYNGYNLQLNNRGVALITQSAFLQSNMHVRMASSFDDVRVVNSGSGFNLADIYDVNMDISGSTNYTITVSSDYLFPTIPQDIRTDIAVHPRPASRNVLRVDLPRATGFNSNQPSTDVSGMLQEALDFLALQGGGTLLLPGGRYLVNAPITVPSGVELRGTWDVQHHTNGGGTAIFTDYGYNQPYSAQALISLSAGSGLRGITFTQRNITAVTHTDQANTPTFPFLVRGLGPDVHIINMTVHLGDNGIDLFTHDTSGHYVDYFGGTLLRRGIWVGGGARGGYIRNMQFNPHYTMRLPEGHQGFHIPSGDLYLFTQGFCSALMFGEVYDQTIFNNFVFGSVYGIHFRRDPITNQYPGTINIIGHGSDGCTFALYVQHAGPNTVINAINSELVNTNIASQPVRTYVRMGGISVSNPTEDWYIHPNAQLNLFNSAFWGSPTVGAQIYGGVVRFQQANFSQLPAIGIDVIGGRAHVYSSRFAPTRGGAQLYARLGADADALELTNNFYRSGLVGNITSAVPFGLFGADIDGEPFEFDMILTGNNPQLRIEYIIRGQSPAGMVRLVSPAHLAADFLPIPFDPINAGQHIFIDFPNYSVHSIGLEIVLDDGRVFEFSAMIDRGYMERAVPGVGNPASRSTLPPLVKESFNYVSINSGPLSWTGPQDLSSVSRFAFSDDNLYAYIVVRDRQHHNEQTGGNIWNGDSLQLGVDLLNITDGVGDDPRRNELGFALNSEDNSIQSHRWSSSPGATGIYNMTVNITRDEAAGTTTYDLIIPTATVVNPASLGVLLSELDRIGVSVFVNDAVNGMRAQELGVMAGHLKNPSLFTALYLMDDGDYDAMIEASARDMVDEALLDRTPANIATALNFIALVRCPDLREALTAELAEFVQVGVESIAGVPVDGYAGVPLTLTGTVLPDDATAQAITWSIVRPGTTNATLSGNVLHTTAGGNVTVRATVVGGGTIVGTDFWQDFVISIRPPQIPDYFTVTVHGSTADISGANNYKPGDTVHIDAGTRPGFTFTGWTSNDGITFNNPSSSITSFVMPARHVEVTATWQQDAPVTIDFTALQALVNQAATHNQANYTAASWAAFVQALANAQAMLVNQDATQAQVDAARTALQTAMTALVRIDTGIQSPPQPPVPPQPPTPPLPPPGVSEPIPTQPLVPFVPRQPQPQTPPTDEPTIDDEYDDAPDEAPDADEPTTDLVPPPSVNRLIFTIGHIEYLLNGQPRTGVGAPFIDPATDRMMIPLRTLAEALGVEVEWESATRSALVHLPTGTLVIPADAMLPDGMGSAMIVNDRVFIPLRFVMYAFDADVQWDSANRAAVITW